MNPKKPDHERRNIIPTEGPPPPARAPEETIPDPTQPVEPPPTSRPGRQPSSPDHAPSQRAAGGRVKLKRTETPVDRKALIIDRQRGAAARAQAGLCSALSSLQITG
ncbi:hypothetical protein WME88_27435 [Sorangium sp. So ce216]